MQRDETIRQQMFNMIAAWKQSGLSQKAYCQQHNIRYHVFHYWYKCFRNLQSSAKDEGFIPLKIQPVNSIYTASAVVELLLADGRRLLFHQVVTSDYLKALIS